MSAGEDIETDVAIVGAGPAGLFSVFACGQLGMRSAVIDALPDPGGQLVALYPEKPIYDIPGRPRVRADELIDDLIAQGAPYRPTFLLGTSATRVSEADGRFGVTLCDGRTVTARAVILAAGLGAFGPNRPPLAGIEPFEGASVHYHVRRREDFSGRHVVIAGGGDSAVDWAFSLADVAASVAVVHRRARFRAAPAEVVRMTTDPRIALHLGWQLAGIEGTAPVLDRVVIADMAGNRQVLPADALIPLFGLASDLSALQGWNIEFEGKCVRVDPAHFETSRPGIFAIGDLAAYPGKRKLILTGFAEAASAAEAAYGRVFPGQALHHEHSTSRGAPVGADPIQTAVTD
ncbi:NAD(P)/FAD-dependent oxidoreductase [Tropicimonas marinistellae]|uniref:NAD(P)/FAD-dependent oxidoreductase n=1 Tax=Tropicimonas marinistellae TaxID=1739787 RepID=UPI00083152DA|nr:NAD(P)/FAD-dependent oxidoreductase [Tropicimonas marinistellae]